jgi:transcriptional regulator with XRE-family HTH domain
MITAIGRFLRKVRIDRDEILRNMSDKLGVTSSYLSAVENGKRIFPDEWEDTLNKLYSFTEQQRIEFKNAIVESKDTFELNAKSVNKPNRELAYVFARKFQDLDEATVRQIKELLGGLGDE